jgi:hypothetical protein
MGTTSERDTALRSKRSEEEMMPKAYHVSTGRRWKAPDSLHLARNIIHPFPD